MGVCSAAIVYNVNPAANPAGKPAIASSSDDLEGAESAQFGYGGYGSPYGYGGYGNNYGGYGGYGGGYGGYGGKISPLIVVTQSINVWY